MTDVPPRRAYPLVVPPPGGFEDAVRRGRGLRRRRAGSSTGAALALVGALAYTLVSTNPDTTGLHPTENPPTQQEQPPPPGFVLDPPASPTASPTAPRPGDGPRTVATGPGSRPVAGPSGTPRPPAASVPATRQPHQDSPGRPYARRGTIHEGEQFVGNNPCLQPAAGQLWCGHARVAEPANPDGTSKSLVFMLCRSIDAARGEIDFSRVQEAEYSVVDVGNNDTVWTYSAGQPVVRTSSETTVDGGYCVEWTYRWNGYDDFGLTPRPGQYELRASSTGTSDTPLPTATYPFTIGDA